MSGHADLEHVPLAAGDPPAVLHLRERPQALLDAGVVDRVALDDADQRGDVQADGGRVDDRTVGGDHPGALQLAHPLVHGRGRQPHLPGQFRVAGAAVGAQQVDQLPVHGVDGVSPSCAWARRDPPSRTEYRRGRTLGGDEGVGRGIPDRARDRGGGRRPGDARRRPPPARAGACPAPGRRAVPAAAVPARWLPTTTRTSCASWSAAPDGTTTPRPEPSGSGRASPSRCGVLGGLVGGCRPSAASPGQPGHRPAGTAAPASPARPSVPRCGSPARRGGGRARRPRAGAMGRHCRRACLPTASSGADGTTDGHAGHGSTRVRQPSPARTRTAQFTPP